MDFYLTERAKPGKGIQLVEKLGLIALFGVLSALVFVAVYGYYKEGLSFGHLFMCIPAVLIVLAMNPIAERFRRRKHAELIVRALMRTEGSVLVEDFDEATGMRGSANTATQLIGLGYLQHITVKKDAVCLGDLKDETPPEEIVPIFQDKD